MDMAIFVLARLIFDVWARRGGGKRRRRLEPGEGFPLFVSLLVDN
jgi:hypothetical protein